jgi:hypothetical protein
VAIRLNGSSTPFLLFMIGELLAVVDVRAGDVPGIGCHLLPTSPDGIGWLDPEDGIGVLSFLQAITPRCRYDQPRALAGKSSSPLIAILGRTGIPCKI